MNNEDRYRQYDARRAERIKAALELILVGLILAAITAWLWLAHAMD